MSIQIRYTDGLFPSPEDFESIDLRESVIICPNPQLADGVRRLFETHKETGFDVITIAKATSELREFYQIEGQALRKAEILMHFATLWKSVHGAKNFEMFIQSYQLFSEFRSFTTNFDLVSEALGSLSSEQQAALSLYWRYLSEAQIMDEHSLYEMISSSAEEAVQSTDGDEPRCRWKNITFWGFPHLSGTQVSLIKALGIVANVHIFFPRAMIPFVHSGDYIAWLDKDVEQEAIAKTVVAADDNPVELETISFAKKRLAGVLRDNFTSEELKGKEILLCAKKADFNLFQEMPFTPIAFKTPSDGLSSVAMFVTKLMRAQYSKGLRSASDFHDVLESELKRSYELQDFRLMRVVLQYKRLLESYHGLSSLNESLEHFDLKLFEEIFISTLPRMFTSSLAPEETPSIALATLSSPPQERGQNVALAIISSHYGPLKSKESYYSDEVGEFLSVVGPLKRSEFEFQFLKLRLRELMMKNRPCLVIEKGLLEHDPAWSELLSVFNLKEKEVQSVAHSESTRELHDFLISGGGSPYQSEMSASSLQLYRDCPRKFYVSKIAKLNQFKELPIEIAPNELGTLEHSLIGKLYFMPRADHELHREVESAIDLLLESKNKNIDPILKQSYTFEVEEAVRNGLRFLDQLGNELRFSKVSFDVKLTHKRGEADCVVEWESARGPRWGLIDFKRSKSSVARKSEVEDLRKLQLPFYLLSLGLEVNRCSFMGYVNLSNTSESMLVSFDHELHSEFKFNSFQIPIGEYEDFARRFIEELSAQCYSDSTFAANPLSAQACTYCPISNVCLKSGLATAPEEEHEIA